MTKSYVLGAFFATLTASILPIPVNAIGVDLELALVLDISGSVDKGEYLLQRDGYVKAFLDPAIQSAIANKPNGIAVSLFYFSTTTTANRLDAADSDYAMWSAPRINWMHLQTPTDVTNFANTIAAETRPVVNPEDPKGDTNIANAINTAASSITNNDFTTNNRVIDISGDGIQNTELNGTQPLGGCNGTSSLFTPELCTNVLSLQVTDAAAAGITINGVAITTESALLTGYFADYVITDDGFVVEATDFNAFGAAISNKIGQEVGVIPVPPALYLFGSGMLGLVAVARRKQAT